MKKKKEIICFHNTCNIKAVHLLNALLYIKGDHQLLGSNVHIIKNNERMVT